MKQYPLLYSDTARNQITTLHPGIKTIVRTKLKKLNTDPYRGKRLERELSGYRSMRANRFRIIYKVNEEQPSIEIHYVGHRKDIYEIYNEQIGRSTAFE